MYIISLKLKFLRIYGDNSMLTADVFLLYYRVFVKSLLKDTMKSGFPEYMSNTISKVLLLLMRL